MTCTNISVKISSGGIPRNHNAPPKTSHAWRNEVLKFSKNVACLDKRGFGELQKPHMSFNLQSSRDNRAIFYSLLVVCFVNALIVNRCSAIRYTETCKIFDSSQNLAYSNMLGFGNCSKPHMRDLGGPVRIQ